MLVLIGGENENGLKNYALRLASHFPMAITKFANVKNEQKKKKYCCFAKLLNFECVRDALAFFSRQTFMILFMQETLKQIDDVN